MKIDYASDLHINHWVTFNNNQEKWKKQTYKFAKEFFKKSTGEVLVLAGDYGEWNVQIYWFMEIASKLYERVFVVLGNHDYYVTHNEYHTHENVDSLWRIKELKYYLTFLDNVSILDKSIEEYKGKIFAGDTMWYFPDDSDWERYFYSFNDSRYIFQNNVLISDRTFNFHKESMDWYKTLEGQHIDVFISHVPPISLPSEEKYGYNSLFITKVPFIVSKEWICGHTHDNVEIKKYETNFRQNALGYTGEDLHCKGIKTFEI